MNEAGLGIGARLRAAREEKGWSVNDVGGRLRLTPRQIEAIENEDFARLGQPVFARGFVRNYAKLVGLDPNELLEQMTTVKVSRLEESESLPFAPRAGFWKSPWVLSGIAVAFLIVAIPLGLYWWLSGNGEASAQPAPAPQQVPPPPPPPAPQIDAPAQPGQGKAAQAVSQEAPRVPPVTAEPPQPASATAPEAAPAAAPATPTAGALRLQFDDISWVQVRDGSGRIVHSGLNPAGSTVDVEGRPPFHLVVGNAEKVRVIYEGKAIDLKPFTSVNVARLTLKP